MINSKPTRVLITGSTGFIGQRLFDLFGENAIGFCRSRKTIKNNEYALGLDSLKEVKYIAGQLQGSSISHLIHAAAVTPWSSNPDFSLDIDMAKSIVWLCEALKIPRLIFISGWNVYDINSTTPFSELTTVKPTSEYGKSKYATEQFFLKNLKNTNLISLRTSSLYGVGQISSGLIPNLVTSALDTSVMTLNSVHTKRDYLYIDDFTQAVSRLVKMSNPIPAKVLNIGSGKSVSVVEVAETIQSIFKSKYLRDIEIKYSQTLQESSLLDNQLTINQAHRNNLLLKVRSLKEGLSSYIEWRVNENIL